MSLIIGIAGGSGAGKTTSADAISQYINEKKDKKIERISLDNFYGPYSEELQELSVEEREKEINYDEPYVFEWSRVLETLEELNKGNKVEIPQYDFTKHDRKENVTETVEPADLIILEGIYALWHEGTNQRIDYKIFVEAEIEKRYNRRLARDINERERSQISVFKQFIEDVQPMHRKNVEPTKDYADAIIDGNQVKGEMIESARTAIEDYFTGLREGETRRSNQQKEEADQAPVV